MEYSKTIKLKNMIFSKNDLIKIAKSLNYENDIDYKIEIEIFFSDDSQIKNDTIEIFDNDYLNERELKKIYIHYRDTNYNNVVNIYLNGQKFIDSCIDIKSNNKTWFLSTSANITERIQSVKKQNLIEIAFNNYTILQIISIILIYSVIIVLINNNAINEEVTKTINFWITLIGIIVVNSFILYEISLLFTNIDFEINTNNTSFRKKIKKYLFFFTYFIIIQIIIPIIISIVFK